MLNSGEMPESLDCMFQQKLDDMLIPAAAQQTMLLSWWASQPSAN